MIEKKTQIFRPVNTGRAFEKISEQVKELVFGGVFKPGDKLPPERELALQFKTGRMVVREALRVLEQAGIVYIKQGSEGGAFIKEPDTGVVTRSISDMIRLGNVSIQDLTEARLGIEKMILDTVMERMDATTVALLEKNLKECAHKLSQGAIAREGNVEFHILLAKASKNPIFVMIEESIMDLVFFFLKQLKTDIGYSKRVMNQHKEIFRAIRKGERQRAMYWMEKHLIDVGRRLTDMAKDAGTIQYPKGDVKLDLK
jgi:DNA-binding FadR family transcriptional regulator